MIPVHLFLLLFFSTEKLIFETQTLGYVFKIVF
jgi:hypothetical protein